jgi:hypothetical protein
MDLDGPVTITTGWHEHGLSVGQMIRLSDRRRWWQRLWDWVRRRPPPNLTYRVTGVVDQNVFTVEKDHGG